MSLLSRGKHRIENVTILVSLLLKNGIIANVPRADLGAFPTLALREGRLSCSSHCCSSAPQSGLGSIKPRHPHSSWDHWDRAPELIAKQSKWGENEIFVWAMRYLCRHCKCQTQSIDSETENGYLQLINHFRSLECDRRHCMLRKAV